MRAWGARLIRWTSRPGSYERAPCRVAVARPRGREAASDLCTIDVRNDPVSSYALDLHGDSRRLRNIADRLPDELSEPLRAVAAAADKFRNVHVPRERDAIDEYVRVFGTTPHGPLSPGYMPFALAAKAIEQYRAATELHNAIDAAWQALRGDESLIRCCARAYGANGTP